MELLLQYDMKMLLFMIGRENVHNSPKEVDECSHVENNLNVSMLHEGVWSVLYINRGGCLIYFQRACVRICMKMYVCLCLGFYLAVCVCDVCCCYWVTAFIAHIYSHSVHQNGMVIRREKQWWDMENRIANKINERHMFSVLISSWALSMMMKSR